MQWISQEVRPVTVPAILQLRLKDFFLPRRRRGQFPYSPATFFRTHFYVLFFIAKSVANFSKLEG